MELVFRILLLIIPFAIHAQNTETAQAPSNEKQCTKTCFERKPNDPNQIVLNSQPVDDQNIGDVCTLVPECDVNPQYRYINGSCNNIKHKSWGMSTTTLVNLLAPVYADNKNFMTDHKVPDEKYTLALVTLTQVFTHDVVFLAERFPAKPNTCCVEHKVRVNPKDWPPTCVAINVPHEDRFYDKYNVSCMEFFRGETAQDVGCKVKPIQHMNIATSFLDASVIYGINDDIAKTLRYYTDGKLNFTIIDGRTFLTFESHKYIGCFADRDTDICFRTGDFSVNQHPQLALMQTVFFRMHNKLCDTISAKHKDWKDEKVFQEVRKIVIAIQQQAIYGTPMKAVFGEKCAEQYGLTPKKSDKYECDYNENINPGMTSEVDHVALRSFHSIITDNFTLYYYNRKYAGHFMLSDWYNNPTILTKDKTTFDYMLIGLSMQPMESMDRFFTSAITNMLLRRKDILYGDDLAAIDLMRARECGEPNYLKFSTLAGFREDSTWADLRVRMGDEMVDRLIQTYRNKIEDIDPLVGTLLEKPCGDSMVGPTLHAVLAEGFLRTKNGDRHYHTCEEGPSKLTIDQLNVIRTSASVGFVFCYGSDAITLMQRDPLRPPNNDDNKLEKCEDLINEFLNKVKQFW